MRPNQLFLISAVLLATLAAQPLFAQSADMQMTTAKGTSIEFADIQPDGFDPGMKIGVIMGDPSVADQPYVLRLSFPDGYRFPAHYHPKAENLTVLSGTFLLGMGEMPDDAKIQKYGAGDFLHIPATHPHFGGASGETVIQLHGMGPFQVMLASDLAQGAAD